MTNPLLEPESIEGSKVDGRWKVVIFNNDHTPQEAVVFVLICATGCEEAEAWMEMEEAELCGSAPVHFANEGECRRIARVISSIGVKTEVAKEWID